VNAARSVGIGRGKRRVVIPRAPSKLETQLYALIRGYQVFPTRAFMPEPVREYEFHPDRKWRFDFAWPDRKVAAECEGATWSRGRHTRGAGFQADCEKYNAAAVMGWRVLRFPKANFEAADTIARALGLL
jgi:hypothetical protein